MELRCSTSNAKISNLRYVGVIEQQKQYSTIPHDFCGDPESNTYVKLWTLFSLEIKQLRSDFQDKCNSQNNCFLNLVDYFKISQLKEKNKKGLDKHDHDPDMTNIYLQYDCDFSEATKSQYRLLGLFVTFQAIITCLIFYYTAYYLRKIADMNFKVWDVLMDTSSDFTVQVTLPEQLWIKWLTLKNEAAF